MQALFGCSVTVLQYVNVSVLPQWLVFYLQPCSAVQEYGGGEHHLYGGDAQVSGWSTQMGARGDGHSPAWLVVNQSVYFGRGWSVTPVFETEGVVSGR